MGRRVMHIPISAADFECLCGCGRRFLWNREGRLILRCLRCENEDVAAHVRLDYANDSRQLLGESDEDEIDEGR